MKLSGRRCDTGQPVCVDIHEGKVVQSSPVDLGSLSHAGQHSDWPWLIPGLIDLQVNGYGGQEFSSASLTREKVVGIARSLVPFGVTQFCPTVTTEGFEVLAHALRVISSVCEGSPQWSRRLPGIHVEGPYITPEDGARGAHPKRHCRPPDWDEFRRLQDAAGGRIRILTMSPEYDGAASFIERVAESGVVVAIGHTSSTPAQIRAAVDAGARLSTHLGNGSHPMLHRLRNYVWPQLADDRLSASLIVDGHHLPPEVVKVFLRAKQPERCILVSDVSGQAGQQPGRYQSPFCDVEILDDGRLVVAGQREMLAGAALPLMTGVINMTRFGEASLADAVGMAADHPAELIGTIPGGLTPGQPADLVQFRFTAPADPTASAQFQIDCVLLSGQIAWGEPWQP